MVYNKIPIFLCALCKYRCLVSEIRRLSFIECCRKSAVIVYACLFSFQKGATIKAVCTDSAVMCLPKSQKDAAAGLYRRPLIEYIWFMRMSRFRQFFYMSVSDSGYSCSP